MGCIYIITNNINNKIYIGKTIRAIKERWEEHCRHFSYVDYPLYLAMRKYGIENFSIKILEDNILSDEDLNEKEQYYIKKYHSLTSENGYNCTLGGEGHIRYDTLQMYELWQQGYSGQEIERIMNIKRSNLLLNRLRSANLVTQDEINERIRINSKKTNSDPVLQYNLNNELIREYNSAAEAGRINNFSSSNIRACCRGELKTAYGYIWRRKNETGPQRPSHYEEKLGG